MAIKKFFDFTKGKKGPLKNLIIGSLGVVSSLYLVNLSWGGLEFLPDNIPFIGNLDEATATLLLLASMRYFGVDLIEMFTGVSNDKNDKNSGNNSEPRYEPPSQ